jgi:predicted DNA-binding transcriptional regulator YafY
VQPDIFNSILLALFKEKKIRITYRSVFKKETTDRIINPLHLILYMGNWHIVAFCENRNEIRDFALSRIKHIIGLEDSIQSKIKSLDIKQFMDNTYGIFLRGKKVRVNLKFNQEISEFVLEQVWFPGQRTEMKDDGGVILSFPAMDLRELAREILSFGPDVEVVEPKELRQLIEQKIRKMGDIYKKI